MTESWDDIKWGEVIQYVDGLAFGMAPDGRTARMGKEVDIRAAIADPAKRDRLSGTILGIVLLEAELIQRKKEDERDGRPTDSQLRHRTSEIRRRGNQRARPMRPLRRERPDFRWPKTG